jgi:hypothetical protein
MDFMRRTGSRTIRVNKQQLIDKIKENKKNHVEEYAKAVIAYKEEALRQLAELTEKVNNGELGVALNLITPIDNSVNYDKIVEMFEWEVEEIVELEQNEFLEYVQDETEFARSAKFSNTMYFVK